MVCSRTLIAAGFAAVAVACSTPSSKIIGHTWAVDPSGGISNGLTLASVSLNGSGEVGFAVGEGGVVLRWDGVAWKADTAAMSAAKGADLQAVAVDASGKRALVVGPKGLVMSWNGTAWKHEPAAEKLTTGRDLFALSFDEQGRTAWVVGQFGMALHWNGAKWTRTPTPFKNPGFVSGGAPVEIFGMWAVSNAGADTWATGNGDRILRWNGKAWKDDKQASSLGSRTNAFGGMRSIAMSRDRKKGWMVGSGSGLAWSGSKWQKILPISDEIGLLSVDCDATGTTVFTVGMGGVVKRWDGTKWASDPSGEASAKGKTLYDIALNKSGNLGFAVGQNGFILRWDGKSWKRDPAGEPASYGKFSSVGMSEDGKSGLAVCFSGTPRRWDGTAWASDPGSGAEAGLNVIWMAPNGDQAFGAGEDGIYRWNGSEWTAEPSGRSLHSLAMTSDGQLGFAGSITGTIYRYNGSSWTEDKQGSREAGNEALYAMSLSSDGKIGFAGGSDVFLRWDGKAWHREEKLGKGHYNSICLNARGDVGFAIGAGDVGDTVMRWDGKSWSADRQASKVFTDSGSYSMALSSDGRTGVAVSFEGPVYFWDGTKWSRDAAGTQLAQGQHLVSVCLDPTGTSGWVLGWQGFLMRYQAISSSAGRS